MDKEEAIKILKNFHDKSALFSVRTALETLHPELKESEDERISKKIKKVLNWYRKSFSEKSLRNEEYDEMFAWIEKQGKQKPAWSEEEEKVRRALIEMLHDTIQTEFEKYNTTKVDCLVWLRKQGNPTNEDMKEALRTEYEKGRADAFAQMQKEWSEEDEVKMNRIVACLENLNVADNDILLKDVDWLKSLKDRVKSQNTWKPSDGQMSALKIATHCPDLGLSRVLKTLYNDLDKLTKE